MARRFAPLCKGLTKDGEPCQFTARNKTQLCINHDPEYRAQQEENTRRGLAAALESRRLYASRLKFGEFNLATREQVQAVLDTVIRLELEGKISSQRSRNLLRACATATRNFNPPVPAGLNRKVSQHNLQLYANARHYLDNWLVEVERKGGLTRTPKEK